MTVSSVSNQSTTTTTKSGFAALGQGDFLRLMTTQMQMQDPFNPVDNKEMLAQMAQFSSLAGISDINTTLQAISGQIEAATAARTDTTGA